MSEQHTDWRPGALRYKGADGVWIVTEPHSAMYSTATMVATEFWDSAAQRWRVILEDDGPSK